MPRFVAIRDCLGFHAAHEGIVGLVGDLAERDLNRLVQHYPGSVYKASFVTADDAVQWLWSNVYNRPANQDLRSRQYQSDARLFPCSVASHVSGSGSSGQLNTNFRKQVFRTLEKMRPAPFPSLTPDAASLYAGQDIPFAPFPAVPMSGWFGQNAIASDPEAALFSCVFEWLPLSRQSLVAALGASLGLDVSKFADVTPLIDTGIVSALASDFVLLARQRIRSMYGDHVPHPVSIGVGGGSDIPIVPEIVGAAGELSGIKSVGSQAAGGQSVGIPAADGAQPGGAQGAVQGAGGIGITDVSSVDGNPGERASICPLRVWLPTGGGMASVLVPRPTDLVHSIDPLVALRDAVAAESQSIIGSAIGAFGRYHCLTAMPPNDDYFIDSDCDAAALLGNADPRHLQLSFRADWVPEPISLGFVGVLNGGLSSVVRSTPRVISAAVLRLCAPGLLFSDDVSMALAVECSRSLCVDLRGLFSSDDARVYHLRPHAAALGRPASGAPLSVSPTVLEWMDESDLSRSGFAHVCDVESVRGVLEDEDPNLSVSRLSEL